MEELEEQQETRAAEQAEEKKAEQLAERRQNSGQDTVTLSKEAQSYLLSLASEK